MTKLIKRFFRKQWNRSDFSPQRQPGLHYSRRFIAMFFTALMNNERKFHKGHIAMCLNKGHPRLFKQIGSLDSSASEPIEEMAFLFRFGICCI